MCYTVKVYNAVALCATGAEKAVSNEIKKLGLTVADSGFGRVRFRSDTAGLYRSLMGLRAADRVLLEAGCFSALDFNALFEAAKALPWDSFVNPHLGFKVVKVRSNRSRLRAETSIQSIVHKAAAERLCASCGLARLPETAAAAEVRIYVEKDMVSVLLDLSGEPLFKRGYRKEGGVAPLRETTAAAMLLLCGWKRKYPLYDPFCGSGTIVTEALMYAWDMAPGIGRTFAIEHLPIADTGIESAVRAELRGRINFERTIRIAGSDEDAAATAIAKANIRRLYDIATGRQIDTLPALFPLPEIQVLPMTLTRANEPGGFIVTNPPYGKRLGDPAASQRIYGEMAVLGRNFSGWKLAVITDHAGFESFFGVKADSCREISNGPIPSYFYQFGDMYVNCRTA